MKKNPKENISKQYFTDPRIRIVSFETKLTNPVRSRYLHKKTEETISITFLQTKKRSFVSKLTDPKSPIKGIGTDTYKKKELKKKFRITRFETFRYTHSKLTDTI